MKRTYNNYVSFYNLSTFFQGIRGETGAPGLQGLPGPRGKQ